MTNPLSKKPFIIADVGSNWKRYSHPDHNLALALRHIDDAFFCGCDAVKFQFYTHKELYGIDGPDEYALPYWFIPKLAAHADLRGIEFMCTAFSPEGANLVDPYVKIHKVASSELQYWDMLQVLFDSNKPIIYSTGAASQKEIEKLFRSVLTPKDVVLECVAAYPAEPTDYNLMMMRAWQTKTGTRVGVSDHTTSNIMAITAVGMGATVFEKHFDALHLDAFNQDTPDAPFAIGPLALIQYCSNIRDAFSILGNDTMGYKLESNYLTPAEEDMRLKHKRRLKVTAPIKNSETTLENGVNFGCFRSIAVDTKAASPEDLAEFEGKKVKRDLQPQDGLWYDDLI